MLKAKYTEEEALELVKNVNKKVETRLQTWCDDEFQNLTELAAKVIKRQLPFLTDEDVKKFADFECVEEMEEYFYYDDEDDDVISLLARIKIFQKVFEIAYEPCPCRMLNEDE